MKDPLDGQVGYRTDGPAVHITFDRPSAHNAMTWSMYEQLAAICERIRQDDKLRVATFRGAGGKSFVSGTDIRQFHDFTDAEDGVRYEHRIDALLGQLASLPIPTLAIVDGWCVGGGLAIAACCDFRIAAPNAKFGVPIARTLGNCLAIGNVSRLAAEFGIGRAKRMLILGEMLHAAEAQAAGFVAEIAEPDQLDARVAALVERLANNAPLTMRASKESFSRVLDAQSLEGDDLVRLCYGSEDFRRGMAAFVEKRTPEWIGR